MFAWLQFLMQVSV